MAPGETPWTEAIAQRPRAGPPPADFELELSFNEGHALAVINENNFEEYLLEAQDYFDYVYYVVLGFGLFLVAILALYTIGILLGSFGSVGGPAKRQGT